MHEAANGLSWQLVSVTFIWLSLLTDAKPGKYQPSEASLGPLQYQNK